jgi:hypothetical protein
MIKRSYAASRRIGALLAAHRAGAAGINAARM